MAMLKLQRGDRVLDIGCGIGATPFALSRAVGNAGEVVAVDLLRGAIEILAADPGLPGNISLVCGDAQTLPMESATFDAAFSRFGVMFFADPLAAFRNVRRALRSGGRLGFVCWRAFDENELDELPLRAALDHLPPDVVAGAARAAPFSFSDPAYVQSLLTQAGFSEIEISAHDEVVGSGGLAAMVAVLSRVGALGKILRDHPELRCDVVPAVEQALSGRDGPLGPGLRAATWVVLARAV